MRNNVEVCHLFEGCDDAKKKFLEWCQNNDEFCEYDTERIEIDLYTPTLHNTDRYFYFHKGNLIDFIEENGLYFDLIRSSCEKGVIHIKFKGRTVKRVEFQNGRKEAEMLAVKECLILLASNENRI